MSSIGQAGEVEVSNVQLALYFTLCLSVHSQNIHFWALHSKRSLIPGNVPGSTKQNKKILIGENHEKEWKTGWIWPVVPWASIRPQLSTKELTDGAIAEPISALCSNPITHSHPKQLTSQTERSQLGYVVSHLLHIPSDKKCQQFLYSSEN